MSAKISVTVWNEFRHEKRSDEVKAVYPDGMHRVIADALAAEPDMDVRTATLDEPEHGLTDDVLDSTDVMLWWGHTAHGEVKDEIAAKVRKRVWAGMGLIPLHSGHMSKPFRLLMGTGCMLRWREAGERERLWVVEPGHPIVAGVGEFIELEHTEMYGERFDVPAPDELVFISWFQGGEVFRSGCCYNRGAGRIFYFRPGHETFPIYKDPSIQRVLKNAVRWARPIEREPVVQGNCKPLEKLERGE